MSKKTLTNTNTEIEILQDGNSIVTKSVENPGNIVSTKIFEAQAYDGLEKTTWKFSGRAKVGQEIKIGTISFAADQLVVNNPNKYFKSTPYIEADIKNSKSKSKTILKYNSTTRDSNGYVIKHVFDVIHKVNEKENNKLTYYINESVSDKLKERTTVTGVTRVDVGKEVISSTGEKRRITITGAPGTIAKFTITKLTNEDRETSGATAGFIREGTTRYNEEQNIIYSTITHNLTDAKDYKITDFPLGFDGTRFDILQIKIPDSGIISFYHNFPAEFPFDHRFVFRIKTSCLSSDTNVNESNGWYDPAASEKAVGNVLHGRGWSGYSYKVLTLVQNPKLGLTLTGSWTKSHLTVTSNIKDDAGRYTDFSLASSPSTWTISAPIYVGKRDTYTRDIRSNAILKNLTFTYTFKDTSGSRGFAIRSGTDAGTGKAYGNPKFSQTNDRETDWTNSFAYDEPSIEQVGNGGTEFWIRNITTTVSTTSTSNDTLTLQYTLFIDRWGSQNLTSDLNLDDIATLS